MQSDVQKGSGEGEMPALRKEGDDDVDDEDIKWGAKLSGNNYKTVFIRGEEYALNDCVRCRSGLASDHVGKIMKLLQAKDKKYGIIRWFFRPSELPKSVEGLDYTPDTKELFLASGEKKGVVNENLLVSSNISSIRGIHNFENELSLGVIVGKCIVLCTAEDDFNEMPSIQQIQAADYFFSKSFDCDSLEVTGLDGLVEEIGAQKVFNKKEWLIYKSAGRSSSQISSPRTHCKSSGSGSLPTYGNAKGVLRPPGYKVPPPKLEESTTKKAEKRKRDETEELPSQRGNSEDKTAIISHISKKPKPSVEKSVTSREREHQQIQHMLESKKSLVVAPDGRQSKGKQGLDSPHVSHGSRPSSPKSRLEEVANGGKRGVLNSSVSSVPPVEPKHVTGKVLKTLERSESSAGRENSSKAQKKPEEGKGMDTRHEVGQIKAGINKSGGLIDAQKKSSLASRRKVDDKVVLTKKPSFAKDKCPPTVTPTPTSRIGKTDADNRAQKEKDQFEHRLEKSLSNTSSRGLEKAARQGALSKSKEQSPVEMVTLEPKKAATGDIVKDTNLVDMEHTGGSPKVDEREVQQAPRGQLFKPKAEVWKDSIERAVQSRRVLLLKNVDPELHSADLENLLTEFLKTKCEVRKSPPQSFFYYETAVALLKLPTAKKAEEILRNMEENCLMLGDRPVIATLFDSTQYLKEFPKFPGHLNIQQMRDQQRDDYKNAVATSHGAQGNTIEFAFGLPWRVLQEQHDMQWQLLKEMHQRDLKFLEKGEAVKPKKPAIERKAGHH